MNKFQPHIIPIYPPHNELIFEEWFAANYNGCNTDRELLPVWFTSFYVNNNYGNDLASRKELQDYLYSLDTSKKYFSIIQYDDSILEDVSHLDLLQFNMSKQTGVAIPLLCQPHPYRFMGSKKWFANFVGGKTHSIRNKANLLNGKEGYYVSFEHKDIETYCRILHESMFTLCFRGYGLSSFRIAESLQYNSIPVYISDKFVFPWEMDFEDFGVVIEESDAGIIDEILQEIPIDEVIRKQERLQEVYDNYFTYEATFKHIIRFLELEYAPTS